MEKIVADPNHPWSSRPYRGVAMFICICAVIASLTTLATVGSGRSPMGDLWRLPFALFVAYVSGFVAKRGRFPSQSLPGKGS